MNVKVQKDRRCAEDKRYDMLFNKLVWEAKLTAKQRMLVQCYFDKLIGEKVQEAENAMNLGFWIALIETERFGCNKRATRLPRLQRYVREVVSEAYGHDCIDANGRIGYDGYGLDRLKLRLKNKGVEVEE